VPDSTKETERTHPGKIVSAVELRQTPDLVTSWRPDLQGKPGSDTADAQKRYFASNPGSGQVATRQPYWLSMPGSDKSDVRQRYWLSKPGSELLVWGANPRSFYPPGSSLSVKVPAVQASEFEFSCELKAVDSRSPAFVNLSFSGVDEQGRLQTWNSVWQPAAVRLSRDRWYSLSFKDTLPAHLLSLKELKAEVLISPFQPDFLYLRRKQALRCRILARDIYLDISATPPLEEAAGRKWLVL